MNLRARDIAAKIPAGIANSRRKRHPHISSTSTYSGSVAPPASRFARRRHKVELELGLLGLELPRGLDREGFGQVTEPAAFFVRGHASFPGSLASGTPSS